MSLLRQSGQVWKVTLFMAMLVLGCLATLLQGFFYEPLGRELAMQIAWGGVGLIIAGIIWAVQAITCPKCRLKLFVHAFRTQGFFTWFAWVLQAEVCPRCGHGQAPRSPGAGRRPKGLKRP